MQEPNEKTYNDLQENPKNYCRLNETLRASYPVIALIFSRSENRLDPELIASIPIKKLHFRIFVLTSNWEDLDNILLNNKSTAQSYEDVKKTMAYSLFSCGKMSWQKDLRTIAFILSILIGGILLIPPTHFIATLSLTAIIVLAGLIHFTGNYFYARESQPFLRACLDLHKFFKPNIYTDTKLNLSVSAANQKNERTSETSIVYASPN